jgi:hypothetical protein
MREDGLRAGAEARCGDAAAGEVVAAVAVEEEEEVCGGGKRVLRRALPLPLALVLVWRVGRAGEEALCESEVVGRATAPAAAEEEEEGEAEAAFI